MRILYVPSYGNRSQVDNIFKNKWPETLKEKNPEVIIVSGGDGGMLHAIQDYADYNVPFFGIAAGTLNFLMNNIDIIEDPVQMINHTDWIETSLVKVKVKREKSNGDWKTVFKAQAANDLVLGHRIMDYHEFKIKNVFKEDFNIKGMGLIISTPLGSTAFHYNNRGSIIQDISGKEIAMSTIVSERKKSFEKRIELHDQKIQVSLVSDRAAGALYIDGQTKVFKIIQNDKIIIKRGKKIKIGFLNKEDFFSKRK